MTLLVNPKDFDGANGPIVDLDLKGLPKLRISGQFTFGTNALVWDNATEWIFHFCDNEKCDAAYYKLVDILKAKYLNPPAVSGKKVDKDALIEAIYQALKDNDSLAYVGEFFPDNNCAYPGMTLRDYFAGIALNALLPQSNKRCVGDLDWAVRAYQIADTMIEARKQPKQPAGD